MMFIQLDQVIDNKILQAPIYLTGAGTTNSSAQDLATINGNVLLTILASSLAAGTLAFTLQDSADNSSFAAADANAIFTPSTGAVATLTAGIVGTAIANTYGIHTQLLRRYVRVAAVATGSLNTALTTVLTIPLNYSNWLQSAS
jgi:hypothetical protein